MQAITNEVKRLERKVALPTLQGQPVGKPRSIDKRLISISSSLSVPGLAPLGKKCENQPPALSELPLPRALSLAWLTFGAK